MSISHIFFTKTKNWPFYPWVIHALTQICHVVTAKFDKFRFRQRKKHRNRRQPFYGWFIYNVNEEGEEKRRRSLNSPTPPSIKHFPFFFFFLPCRIECCVRFQRLREQGELHNPPTLSPSYEVRYVVLQCLHINDQTSLLDTGTGQLGRKETAEGERGISKILSTYHHCKSGGGEFFPE